MDKHAKIKKLLEGFGLKPNLPITATVLSISGDTCSVKLQSALVLSDVRLKATIDSEEDELLVVPKVGSSVIVFSQTGDLSGLMVLKVSAVEKILFKKGALELEVDGTTGKVGLKKGIADFATLINNLIDTISGAQLITPNGPGTINPITQGQLAQIKTTFNLILKSN